MSYEFGEFIFDTAKQELLRNGEPVHLTPKAMHLLSILIEHRPNVISHEALFDELWPDVVVVDANLKNLVADLRVALDDHQREGRFLRTVHGRGYAFTDNVLVSRLGRSRLERLVFLVRNGERLILQPGENIIGRGGAANIIIDDHQVSRHHARIVLQPDAVLIQDLASRNGTYVRGERIAKRIDLLDGDEIHLGNISLEVRIVSHADESTTDASS